MSLIEEAEPWWLVWVLPVIAFISAVGGGLIWLGRVILLPGIKAELEELLKERFREAHDEVVERHAENQEDFAELNRRLDETVKEQKELRKGLSDVMTDVAYLRGRSSGTFKRP